jgi:hypothetical protein
MEAGKRKLRTHSLYSMRVTTHCTPTLAKCHPPPHYRPPRAGSRRFPSQSQPVRRFLHHQMLNLCVLRMMRSEPGRKPSQEAVPWNLSWPPRTTSRIASRHSHTRRTAVGAPSAEFSCSSHPRREDGGGCRVDAQRHAGGWRTGVVTKARARAQRTAGERVVRIDDEREETRYHWGRRRKWCCCGGSAGGVRSSPPKTGAFGG